MNSFDACVCVCVYLCKCGYISVVLIAIFDPFMCIYSLCMFVYIVFIQGKITVHAIEFIFSFTFLLCLFYPQNVNTQSNIVDNINSMDYISFKSISFGDLAIPLFAIQYIMQFVLYCIVSALYIVPISISYSVFIL